MKKHFCLAVLPCLIFAISYGQKRPDDHDSSYYKTYRGDLTARAFLSRKYTVLVFNPESPLQSFKYRANTSLNLGIGATYHAFTLNIGVGLAKFNPNEEKGKTKYLDLQGHFYTRKWNVDFLGEFYKGYYLTPQGLAAPQGEPYYIRPDMGLSMVGVAIYRSLNEKHFSYQAGLLQNEWQKKSAGSVLVGAEVYYGAIHGDSTLTPTILDPVFSAREINKFHFFSFGPGVGYGYTLVVKEHFFALASATVNLAFRYSEEISSDRDQQSNHFAFRPNYIIHAGLGYNSDKWCLSLLWVDSEILNKGSSTDYHYGITAGNYRLIYARRFSLDRKTKKLLEPIPQIIGE